MFNMIKAEVFKTLILIWLGSDGDPGSQVDNSIFQSLQPKSGKSSQPERNTNCEGWVLRIIWRLDLETLTGCNKIEGRERETSWYEYCVAWLRPYDLPDKLSKFVNTKSMLTTKFKLKYLSSTVNTGRGDIYLRLCIWWNIFVQSCVSFFWFFFFL